MNIENICLDTIKEVKSYLIRKDYKGLEKYVEEREQYVKAHIKKSENKSSEYIDTLIKDLC